MAGPEAGGNRGRGELLETKAALTVPDGFTATSNPTKGKKAREAHESETKAATDEQLKIVGVGLRLSQKEDLLKQWNLAWAKAAKYSAMAERIGKLIGKGEQ